MTKPRFFHSIFRRVVPIPAALGLTLAAACEADGAYKSQAEAGGGIGDAAESGITDPDASDAEALPCTGEKPTIWLLIDGSGSMLTPLGEKTRWATLKEALLDPEDGAVKRFEHDVQWGLFIYDGSLGGSPPQGLLQDGGVIQFEPTSMCPRVVTVSAGIDNYQAISSAFTQYPLGGSTPTHLALAALLDQLPSDPAALSQTSLVLATDGEPNDLCDASTLGVLSQPPDVRPLVVDAVTEAAARRVKTFVINLAADDEALTQHLAQVAKAGGTGQSSFNPGDQETMADALGRIIAARQSCAR